MLSPSMMAPRPLSIGPLNIESSAQVQRFRTQRVSDERRCRVAASDKAETMAILPDRFDQTAAWRGRDDREVS